MTTSAHPFPDFSFFWAFSSVLSHIASTFFHDPVAFFRPLPFHFWILSFTVSFQRSSRFSLQRLLGAPQVLSFLWSFSFRSAWFPMQFFRFCLLSVLFVSFRPSLLRSRSRSAGAHLSLSLRCFPWLLLSFVRISFRLLTTQPLFLPFLSLPGFASQLAFPALLRFFRSFGLSSVPSAWFPVQFFRILSTRLSVCFLSCCPASLPQLFRR